MSRLQSLGHQFKAFYTSYLIHQSYFLYLLYSVVHMTSIPWCKIFFSENIKILNVYTRVDDSTTWHSIIPWKFPAYDNKYLSPNSHLQSRMRVFTFQLLKGLNYKIRPCHTFPISIQNFYYEVKSQKRKSKLPKYS